MKKATLKAIYETLKTVDCDPAILDELNAELTKGEAAKAANAAVYEQAKPIVFGELGKATEAVTIGELYDAVEGELPEGFTKGKLQYAITRLWIDELERVEGKVNAYKLA